MALTEQEIEFLESYVDGELSTDEEERLRQRMSNEPELAAAMESVRAERALRLAVWKSFEPSEASVKRLIDRVDTAVDRDTAWSYRMPNFRIAGAAAACILIGVLIGRVSNGPGGSQNDGPLIAQLSDRDNTLAGQVTNQVTNVAQSLEFPIVNEFGQPLESLRFNSARDAREFLEGLSQLQKAQEQSRTGGGALMVPSSERF